VDVHAAVGMARTALDPTFFNPAEGNQEGTCFVPLPADANLERLALYVGGQRPEGGMVEHDRGRDIYESIVRTRRDPALLEWVDALLLRLCVFPLEPRQEKRVGLSYVQRLPVRGGRYHHRFAPAAPDAALREWAVGVRVQGGAGFAWEGGGVPPAAAADGPDLVLTAGARDTRYGRPVALTLADPAIPAAGAARSATFTPADHRYLLVRYRPQLPAAPPPAPRDFVVVMETGGDRTPQVARAQVKVVRALLARLGPDDRFAVATAGTSARRLADAFQANTPAARDAAVAFLERAHTAGRSPQRWRWPTPPRGPATCRGGGPAWRSTVWPRRRRITGRRSSP
jgi:Ca-activated chloride channel family protein